MCVCVDGDVEVIEVVEFFVDDCGGLEDELFFVEEFVFVVGG